ncbi:cytochrome P450 [Rhexocercosporidium sp. MPI-PUGE-AT-0058]|nr:cytochrome P450 [Rhexocercosporidium sp. MPI-PUGE-AT-0058]
MLSITFNALHWTGLLLSSTVLYFLGLIIYRLTLHPLAKYPGPFLAKITDLDNVYHVWMWDRHVNFMKCHEKYGPIYRYGPNRLSFNTSSALHSIHGFKANVQKASFYTAFQTGIPSSFSLIDKVRHGQRRRVIAHAFSERALKGVEDGFLKNIRTWCGRLRELGGNGGGGLDMSKWCTYLTFDVMGSLAFGRSFNMSTSPKNHYVPNLMRQGGIFAHYNGNMLWAYGWGLTSRLFPGITAGRNAFRAYAKLQAQERVNLGVEGNDVKDFFHYLIEAKDPETGEGFTMNELWGEANLIIIAGSETTSTVLAGIFFYLTHNLDVLEKVKSEVRTVFEGCDSEDIVSGPKLNDCVYLRACLEETLRMAPPVPGPLPREVCAGGAEIDGELIPEGVDVSVGIYSIQHNASYFPEPYAFRPERWIIRDSIKGAGDSKVENLYDGVGVGKEEVEIAQKAFCAFSFGSRGCIGKNMAYMELMLAMARVLFLFDIETAGTLGEGEVRGDNVEWRLRDCFNASKEGPLIKFVERKR